MEYPITIISFTPIETENFYRGNTVEAHKRVAYFATREIALVRKMVSSGESLQLNLGIGRTLPFKGKIAEVIVLDRLRYVHLVYWPGCYRRNKSFYRRETGYLSLLP